MLNYSVVLILLEVTTTPNFRGLHLILVGCFLPLATAWEQLPRLQSPGFAEVTAPVPGAVLQGVVTIEGTASHPGFVAYELSFAYDPDPTDTWFPLGELIQTPVQRGRLGLWDTMQITDGDYRLRLRVWLDDGRILTDTVTGLRIRNERPVETPTPGGVAPTRVPATSTPVPLTPTPTARPAPSPSNQVRRAFVVGALAAASGLGLLGAYAGLRADLRDRAAKLRARYVRWQERRSRRGRRRG